MDVLKLDRVFVRGMMDNAREHAIVRSVATLCNEIGIEMVAEGIETEEQREAARELGVTEGQGYLFARPLDADALSEWLQVSA